MLLDSGGLQAQNRDLTLHPQPQLASLSVSEGLDRSRAVILSAFWKAPILILGKPKPLEMTVCESMNNYFFKFFVVSVLNLNSLPDGSTVCLFALETAGGFSLQTLEGFHSICFIERVRYALFLEPRELTTFLVLPHEQNPAHKGHS